MESESTPWVMIIFLLLCLVVFLYMLYDTVGYSGCLNAGLNLTCVKPWWML
jgi:hypothetical protein